MFVFMIILYIIGAIISFAGFCNHLSSGYSLNSEMVVMWLIMLIMCIINICVFTKLGNMEDTINTVMKHLKDTNKKDEELNKEEAEDADKNE